MAEVKDELDVEEVDLDEEDDEEPEFYDDPREKAEEEKAAEQMSESHAKSALDQMLSSDPKPPPTEEYDIKRLGFVVTLRGVGEKEIDVIGRRSERKPTKSERARGLTAGPRDPQRFNLLLTAEGMVDPDLRNAQLLSKDGPRPEDVVQKWFLPGEVIQMADIIMELSGYGDEAVVRAKK